MRRKCLGPLAKARNPGAVDGGRSKQREQEQQDGRARQGGVHASQEAGKVIQQGGCTNITLKGVWEGGNDLTVWNVGQVQRRCCVLGYLRSAATGRQVSVRGLDLPPAQCRYTDRLGWVSPRLHDQSECATHYGAKWPLASAVDTPPQLSNDSIDLQLLRT